MKRAPSNGQSTFAFRRGAAWECHGIFSEHFISTRLNDASTWPKDLEDAARIHNDLQDLWTRRYRGLAQNEETTRREFIDKVLDHLKFSYRSSLDIPVERAKRTPDYLLFEDEEAKDRTFNSELNIQYASAIALLEAKKVFLPLDAITGKETRFPHQQVRDYLDSAADHSGHAYFRWAILCNGNEWRLYCRDAHPTAYFSFHLAGEAGTFCTKEEFNVFLTLFSPVSFIEADGRCLLDDVRDGALQYQTELEQSIRKRIFGVVADLANGFWEYAENSLQESDLKTVYDSCLIFLYRLLFVLYAEARGLLPVHLSGTQSNELYRSKYSLQRLVTKLMSPREYATKELSELYEELMKLFQLIDGGRPRVNKACGVPLYNGGLFDPSSHPNLEQWRIGDSILAEVLRKLIFAPSRGEDQFGFDFGAIDYADLEVRQLGDIYEGLLGGHLELNPDTNRLVLLGERRALQESGTFYTPDWVVRFLVERTLEPLVTDIEHTANVKESRKTNQRDNSFADRVLALNVLDPAMGSGHFLVRATEWLADQIVYHPTTLFHTGKLENPGLTEEAEISHWRRRVVEHCIFGVDLNPLAVELAKLSLWLTCIASEEPLNFLDHHLRRSNALVGSELSSIGSLAVIPDEEEIQTKLSLGADFSSNVAAAIQAISTIEGQDSTTIEIVKNKEKSWAGQVLPRLRAYKEIANIWIAAAGGLPLTQFEYCSIGELTMQVLQGSRRAAGQLSTLLAPYKSDFDKIIGEMCPCHWELEFPEAFYDSNGQRLANPGFDAILGNPPYISTQTSSEFATTKVMKILFGFSDDLYAHFIAKGFRLLRVGGHFGFVVSDTFFTLASKEMVRELLQKHKLRYLVQCDPFDATVDAAMFVAEKFNLPNDQDDFAFTFIQARHGTEQSSPDKEIADTLKHRTAMSPGAITFKVGDEDYQVQHGTHGCLRVHTTSIEPYRSALKTAFFEPTDASIRLYNRLMVPWKELVSEWWEHVENAKKFAEARPKITEYHNSLKAGDITLVGLIAEGAQGMRTGNNGRFLGYLDGTPQAEEVKYRQAHLLGLWETHPRIGPVLKPLMRSDSFRFENVVEGLKENFEYSQELALKKGEVYRITDPSQVATQTDFERAYEYRSAELREHWASEDEDAVKKLYNWLQKEFEDDFCKIAEEMVRASERKEIPFRKLGLRNGEVYSSHDDAPRIATIFSGIPGARAWVPFRKGDPEGHKWTTAESLMILWSRENVRYLQEARESRWQGYSYFFLPGVTWTLYANHVALKARLQPKCVFDAGGSRLTPFESVLSTNQFLGFLNSDLFSFIVKRFVKNTQDYEVNDVRMTPLILPDKESAAELEYLVTLAIQAKELSLTASDPTIELIRKCERLAEKQNSAPHYLRPTPQMLLFHSADDCLELIESAINWNVEQTYGVEGLGPFDEF